MFVRAFFVPIRRTPLRSTPLGRDCMRWTMCGTAQTKGNTHTHTITLTKCAICHLSAVNGRRALNLIRAWIASVCVNQHLNIIVNELICARCAHYRINNGIISTHVPCMWVSEWIRSLYGFDSLWWDAFAWQMKTYGRFRMGYWIWAPNQMN